MFNFLKSLFGSDQPNVPTFNGVPFDPQSPAFTSRDSRPYQRAVTEIARKSGLKSCEVFFIDDIAAHVDPATIAEVYGKDIADACARLQEYNGRR